MLIYNNKCPTINHSSHYEYYIRDPNNQTIIQNNPQQTTYQPLIPPQQFILPPPLTQQDIEERRLNQYIYYTLNADSSYDFLNKYTPEELQDIIQTQQTFITQQIETLLEYQHISLYSAKLTTTQYHDLIFINNLAFHIDYIQDIINHKLQLQTQDTITSYTTPQSLQTQQPQTTKTLNPPHSQQYEINTQELRRISGYSPYVTIDGKQYHIKWQEDLLNDKHRYIYILGSRQIGKSLVTSQVAYENSFIPSQKILVCSFSANSTNNMRDYILEFAENTPALPNGQPAFTYHAKEAFIVNNITKSKIFFRTLAEEGKGIRGMKLHLVIIDEAAFVANEIYERVLKPTTTTTKGRIIALSTPEKKNWFYEKVMNAAKELDNPNSITNLYEIDYKKNPFIYADPDLLKDIEENRHKPSIRQEYMCEFAGDDDVIFNLNFLDFFPQLHSQAHYTLSYDPARKGKDQAAFSLTQTINGQTNLLQSGYIPQNLKTEWITQAKFLKEIQDKYKAYLVMDVTGVGDGVIEIMKQYGLKVHMAVNYTNSTVETLDRKYPYGSTKCYKVGKGVLINKTMEFCDQEVLQIYEYTNTPLLKEIGQLTKKKNSLGQILFDSAYYDDATNALLLNIYYIYNQNLLSKPTNTLTKQYNPYDPTTHIHHKKPSSRVF